ncbi:GNAT family N-acetyltransferase [candidate division CSSED10-310 bacterium]|uniref:GNAT family N-acetyltransferase n=1 Tax=candidate division CSSED10-310 bacterium TaxID=2855610 RepID=A0ABV6Z5H6_UNCC1
MELKELSHRVIAPYLEAQSLLTLFPLYVCRQRPSHKSWAVYHKRTMQGSIVTGKDCGIYPVDSYWLFARTSEVAALLLHRIKETQGPDVKLSFPLEYLDLVSELFPERTITIDRYYILLASRFHERPLNQTPVNLTKTVLKSLDIQPEMRAMLGSDDDFHEGIPFYGISINGTLVSIGETLVDIGTIAAIQQIYTLPPYRGQGLALEIVSFLAGHLIRHHKMPTYLVSEDNVASQNLARKIGFELYMRFGCL